MEPGGHDVDLEGLIPAAGGDRDSIRGPYRRARGWRNRVTEAQVRVAVSAFEAKGGMIGVLPDECVPPRLGIPWWYGTYESLTSLKEGTYE